MATSAKGKTGARPEPKPKAKPRVETRAEPARTSEAAEPEAPVCTVAFCPLCLAVTSVQPMKPEAIEHLLLAGREFLLAAKSILDARTGEAVERGRSGKTGDRGRSTLEKIDIE